MRENGQLLLAERSKEELIEIILEKEKRIQELERKLREKEKKEAEKKFLKALRLAQRVRRPKIPGQKVGHVGLTRSKPERIDRVVTQTLKRCPDCHSRLSRSQEVIEHTQEDLVPAHPEVTLFKKHRYWCRSCEKVVTASYAPEEIPHGYLGPNVLIQTVILKYHHGLPFNKIKELFQSLAHLQVSEGALAQALQRMSEWLGVEVKQIIKAIRESPHLHMDETGWKVSGASHWLWAIVNERLAYYQIAESRGAKVPKKILPKDYGGILITDFYSAYNRLPGKKQKCLVHLLREMRQLAFKDSSEAFVKYHKILRRILRDALRLKENRETLRVPVYQGRIRLLKKRLFLWSCREYRNQSLRRLAKRFLTHWLHLLTFLEHPEIPFNNNLAERMIRPHVILRNRSFQNRSPEGAKAHETLMSLLHTLQLQKQDPLSFFKKAYLRHRQGDFAPILSL